ncbi:MAG: hypothetical protein AAFQ09_03085 [Pseudomonadota bacterium]
MTVINGQPQPPQIDPAKQKQIETKTGDFLNGGAAQHQRGQTNHGMGGQNRSNSSVLVSQGALESLIAEGQHHQKSGHDAMEDGSGKDQNDDENTHVLVTLTPDKAASRDVPALQTAAASNQDIKTDEVAKLVSRQMDAALRAGPTVQSGPMSLSIPLDASTGLKEVQVAMNDGTLTVTVLRAADQAQHDIRQAAANLAQILQSRYPTKTVKVAEKISQDDDASVGTVQGTAETADRPGLSDLFSHAKKP